MERKKFNKDKDSKPKRKAGNYTKAPLRKPSGIFS